MSPRTRGHLCLRSLLAISIMLASVVFGRVANADKCLYGPIVVSAICHYQKGPPQSVTLVTDPQVLSAVLFSTYGRYATFEAKNNERRYCRHPERRVARLEVKSAVAASSETPEEADRKMDQYRGERTVRKLLFTTGKYNTRYTPCTR